MFRSLLIGSSWVSAPSIDNVQSAIEHIYPLVQEFGKQRSDEEMAEFRRVQARKHAGISAIEEFEEDFSESELEDYILDQV